MSENESKEHRFEFTICRGQLPALPVTVVAKGCALNVDVAIALLHGARDALRSDIGPDGKNRTAEQQMQIDRLIEELETVPA